jgi:hypothetical protein
MPNDNGREDVDALINSPEREGLTGTTSSTTVDTIKPVS